MKLVRRTINVLLYGLVLCLKPQDKILNFLFFREHVFVAYVRFSKQCGVEIIVALIDLFLFVTLRDLVDYVLYTCQLENAEIVADGISSECLDILRVLIGCAVLVEFVLAVEFVELAWKLLKLEFLRGVGACKWVGSLAISICHLNLINCLIIVSQLILFIIGMKKSFNITNYLNNDTSLSAGILAQNQQAPNRTHNQPNYNINIKEDREQPSPPKPTHEFSPLPRTITAETTDLTNRKKENSNKTIEYVEPQVSTRSKQSGLSLKNAETSRGRTEKYLNSGDQAIFRAVRDARYYQRELQNSIAELKDVKRNLQSEISNLQRVLDETSRHLGSIDKEFDKIKLRILEYTARCLDAGFIQYRKNMTRWSKYQEVQKKGLELTIEMSDYIKSQQALLDSKTQQQIGTLQDAAKESESRIVHYSQMVSEISKVKDQCLNKRPILREKAIAEFQRAALELAVF